MTTTKQSEDYMGNLKNLSPSQLDRFYNIQDGFKSFGYEITSEPAVGCEARFIDQLLKGFVDIERKAEALRSSRGYKGTSQRLKADLHHYYPQPMFGVEVGSAS